MKINFFEIDPPNLSVAYNTEMISNTFTILVKNASITGIETHKHLGEKRYEIKDHLGNVRLVFSDLKDVNIGTTTRYRYNLDVRAVNNYYPFGMLMPDMSWQSSGYRYGYNGMEMDNDIKGTGNHLSTHFRGLDPRVGRWGSTDPAEKSFPGRSSYISMGNNPVNFLDKLGDDEVFFNLDGSEVMRIHSNTSFKTFIQTNNEEGISVIPLQNNYKEVEMPKIISGYESPKFQKHDYMIAAETAIFNENLKNGIAPTWSDNHNIISMPAFGIDVNIVKSIIAQESSLGQVKGNGTGFDDIMQVNVYLSEKSNDWVKEKERVGLTKGQEMTPVTSVQAGIKWFYLKGNKSNSNAQMNWQSNEYGLKRYNGGGVPNYAEEVLDKYNSMSEPEPSNYVEINSQNK